MSQQEGYVDADYLDLTTRLLAPSKHRSYELMHLVVESQDVVLTRGRSRLKGGNPSRLPCGRFEL